MAAPYLPTLKQLQYLISLADHGHFGRAADAMFVSQSTLSAGLRELETLLGVTLVERTRRVVRFTPLGIQVTQKARVVLRDAEELTDLARVAGKPLSGELRLSVIPTIAPFLLPRVLPELRRRYPELKLFLREEPSAAACESLHAGRADCVLLALPYACGDVALAELFPDRLFVALPKAEAAAEPIAAGDIEMERLLLLEDGHCLSGHALALCNRPGVPAAMVGTSLHTIVQMIDNGLGITMLPKMAIEAGILEHTGVAARALASADAARTIALAWRKSSPREHEFRLIADVLMELAG